ncbi:MAG: hypothetical protein KAV87_45035 [Desulfobacteraceae bacterium]|nr:hypothetical protein [Desulfobacteraceae bacterium]
MTDREKISVSKERPFSAHHMLLGAARAAIEDAESKRPGWFYSELMAITMSGLAIEALCNAVGERVIDNWNDFESSSPKAKVRVICKELDIEYKSEKEPWSSVVWLSKIRNDLAHAKPQLVNESYIWIREEYEKKDGFKPRKKGDRFIFSLKCTRKKISPL